MQRLLQHQHYGREPLVTSPDHMQADRLTQEGINALKAGRRVEARVLLARSLKLNADNERAWLWLSGAVDSDADRRHCLRRALAINPNSAAARAGLAQLDRAPVALPATPQEEPPAPALHVPIPVAPPPPPSPPLQSQQEEPHADAPETVTPAILESTPAPAIVQPVQPVTRPAKVAQRRAGTSTHLAGLLYDLVFLVVATMIWLFSGINPAPLVERNATVSTPEPASASVVVRTSTPEASPSPRSITPTTTVNAATRRQIVIEDRGTSLAFPDQLTFRARVASIDGLAQVVLEYGVKKLTCGTVVARAFPTFKPGLSANVEWTWEMRQSGSEPPGSIVWYRWRVVNKTGDERVSEEQQVLWLDNKHRWQQTSRDGVTLHWYDAPPSFAADLLDTAGNAIKTLNQNTGLTSDAPIDLYIYSDSEAMRDAVLYEPGWSGGLAFPDHAVVIIGIGQDQLNWGERATAHELTHVLVGRRAFGCLGSVPTWLNEGIAVVGQGGPEQEWQDQLKAALKSNALISVRALSGGFSEHADLAGLSYAQSYSLVNYLLRTFGPAKLLALFDALRAGTPLDAALQGAYTFGVDGLEDRWRASVGARARSGSRAAATPTSIPTPVPTYAPINTVGSQ